MAQKFLQKNINLFLIFILVIMIGLVVIITMYYESRFEDVSGVYRFLDKNLSTCEVDLANTKNELSKLSTNLNSTESDIRKYDELYVTKANELESAKTNLDNAKSALSLSEKNLQEYKAKYESEKNKADKLIDDNNKLSIEVASLTSEVDRKNRIISDLNAECGS